MDCHSSAGSFHGEIGDRPCCEGRPRSRACRSPSNRRMAVLAGGGVHDVDHQRRVFQALQRFAHGLRMVAVGDQHLGLAVLQAEADGRAVQPRVDRVEDGAGHRHAVVRFEQRRHVGRHDRHGIARADAGLRQCRGQPPAAPVQLGIGDAPVAVHHRDLARIDLGGALEEAQRRQRDVVRLAPRQPIVGRRGSHWRHSPAASMSSTTRKRDTML